MTKKDKIILKLNAYHRDIPLCIFDGKKYVEVEDIEYVDAYIDKDGQKHTGFIKIL